MKQTSLYKTHWKHRYSHGGVLRQQRAGRRFRPLSGKDPLHLVFKARREKVKSGFRSYRRYFLIQHLVRKYSVRFFVKVEQISVQGDHIHLLIRASRRTQFQSFFRVVAGQIAQEFEKRDLLVTDTPGNAIKLWKHRPFTRVVKGWKAYKTVRNYIQLNEKEALREIPYKKRRLPELSLAEWQALWE